MLKVIRIGYCRQTNSEVGVFADSDCQDLVLSVSDREAGIDYDVEINSEDMLALMQLFTEFLVAKASL